MIQNIELDANSYQGCKYNVYYINIVLYRYIILHACVEIEYVVLNIGYFIQ